jgi:hypothetical protein
VSPVRPGQGESPFDARRYTDEFSAIWRGSPGLRAREESLLNHGEVVFARGVPREYELRKHTYAEVRAPCGSTARASRTWSGLGVDLGIENIATTSDGDILAGRSFRTGSS